MEDKKITPIRLTDPERRAIKMLSGSRDKSVSEWTSDLLREQWESAFPGMEYPDEHGQIKPIKRSSK